MDEQSRCRRVKGWKWGEQRSSDVWRWTCWARGQPNSGKAQKQWHTKTFMLCACKLLYSLTERESEEEKKIQWNLNNPWSWKQTLWILKDFDAFIEGWLCFKFIWTILHDACETSNMLWILMAQWAACDKWWNTFECRLSLADCWGLFHYGYSLYFEHLQNLAGINSLKALSLSTLCSPQPLNSKTERIGGVWGRLMWYWWAKKINIKVKHLKNKTPLPEVK